MSWLCDICGYENEFNDESQPTICLCCGESAPDSKIIKVRKELDAYHQEQERKARLEELRRKQELRQQKINRIVACITRVVNAIPVTAVAIIIISLVWIGISFHSEGMTLSAWNIQMYSNIDSIPLKGCLDKLKNNMVDIGSSEKMLVSIEETGQLVASQMAEHFSTMSGNITAKSVISASDYSDNIEELNKSISGRNNYLAGNVLLVLENVVNDLKQVGEQVSTVDHSITISMSNMKLNWSFFWKRAKSNGQKLIDTITKREGEADD